MSFVPGQRTEARCTRCKDITGHVVVIVLDGVPAKVECCACGSVHKYYPPEAKRATKESSPLRVRAHQDRDKIVETASKKAAAVEKAKSPVRKTATSKKTAEKHTDFEQIWQDSLAKNLATPKSYCMTIHLISNDVIEHPTFGTGIVRETMGHDKATVLFREGMKTLRCVC